MTSLNARNLTLTATTVLFFVFIINSLAFATANKQKGTLSKAEQKTINQIGRYQIVPVEYDRSVDGQRSATKSVLKIDTHSGRTWILSESYTKQGEGGAAIIQGWFELNDDPDLIMTDKTGAIIKRIQIINR